MNKWSLYAFGLLAGLSSFHQAQAMDCKQEDRYVYCQYTLYDMSDDRKKELLDNFKVRLNARLQEMNVPKDWDDAADKVLINDDVKLGDIIDETERRATEYTTDRFSHDTSKRPVGYFFAIGGNISGNLPIGVGASGTAMATFAFVPTIITRFDKITGKTISYAKNDFDAGGLLQGGIGFGGAGGGAIRWGFGVIFGDVAHASNIIGAGFAEGIAADADLPISIPFLKSVLPNGITVLTMKNAETKSRDLMVYATHDIGPANAKVEVHGSLFYLMSAEEFARFTHLDKILPGVTTPSPGPSHLPNPIISRDPNNPIPDCATGRSTENCDDDGNPLPNPTNPNPLPNGGGPVIQIPPHPVIPLFQPDQTAPQAQPFHKLFEPD
jgi:hypothetical protein